MGNVIDDISNDELLRTAVILGGTIGANLIAPGSGAFVGAGLGALLQPDIESLQIKRQYEGLKTNPIGNITSRTLIYGERVVGGQVFQRNTTKTVSYEDVPQDQENEYLHQFIVMTGHECESVESYFINNSPVTLDVNNLVNENKFRAPITRGGQDVTTQIQDNFTKWLNIERQNKSYFQLNNGRLYVSGIEPNTTYDFTGQELTIEGISTLDIYFTVYIVHWMALNGSSTFIRNHYSDIKNNYLNYTFPENPSVDDIYKFTIQAPFVSDSEGNAEVIVDKQILIDSALYQTPGSPRPFSPRVDLGGGVALDIRWSPPEESVKVNRSVFFKENVSNTKAIRILSKNGTSEQNSEYDPNIADAYKGADFELNTSSPFCAGNCYLYAIARYHPNIFQNIGIPSFQAKIKGKKVYDTRTSTTAWSQNPVLHLYDYLTNSFYGLGVTAAEIDTTTFNAAANVCDENVTIADGGTQKRYTCDIVLFMDQDHRSNIQNILATMAGTLVYSEGKYKVYAGAWTTPTITIDESWLSGGISVVPKESKRSLFNTVKGLYVDTTAQDDYNEFPSVTSSSYVTADNGEELITDLQFLGVTDVERAQRLAKIYLQRHRYSEVITMTCNYKAMQLSVMDTVNFNNSILGYSNKTYRVLDWSFNQNGNGIDLTLRHETSAVYTWTETEATIPDAATILPIPDYNHVELPGSPVVNEEIYSTTDGSGVKVRALIDFVGSADAFITTYQFEYKLVSAVGYIILGRTQSTSFEISDIKAGLYEFRVKAINSYGVSSDYSSTTKEIIGLSEPPADITGFSINIINNNAHLSWNQTTDLDVKIGGQIIVKHTTETASPTWANSLQIIPAVAGKDTSVVVPLLSGTYLIKAQDSTGNVSQNASYLSVTVPNMAALNVVTTQNEQAAFSGTKTNMTVIDSKLTLNGIELFDDANGNFDDASGSFDQGNLTGFQTSGEYEFSSYIDLGKVVTSRASMNIDWVTTEPGNFFDDYDGNFDDTEGYFDGTENAPINVIPYIRTTDDDPAGSPTWSGWQRFYIGDYNCRAYDFKLSALSNQNNFNLEISSLSATVDMPDIVDSGSATTSSGGETTVNFNANYYSSSPNVTGTIVNGSSGDYISISNVTATGFDVSVYNSGSSRIAKTVVWMSKGF